MSNKKLNTDGLAKLWGKIVALTGNVDIADGTLQDQITKLKAVATTSVDGLMSASDKNKLNNMPRFRHYEGTLPAGQTSITFSSSSIKDGIAYQVFSTIKGVEESSLPDVVSGKMTLHFPPQDIDMDIKLLIL